MRLMLTLAQREELEAAATAERRGRRGRRWKRYQAVLLRAAKGTTAGGRPSSTPVARRC